MELDHPLIPLDQAKELTFEKCLRVLNLEPTYSVLDLRRQFIVLSKKFHPDIDPTHRDQYVKITKSYDLLKKVLEGRDPLNIRGVEDTPFRKVSRPRIVPPDNPSVLQYTVKLNWLEILTTWAAQQNFYKTIRYGYKKKCMCEEVCMTCRGTGVESSSRCLLCYGNGWVHYCDECEGKGSYLKKEEYELSLPYGQLIDREILVEDRGDEINSQKRGPLLLTITFLDNVKQLRPNLFSYTVYITPGLLKQPFLEVYLSRHLTVKILCQDIKEIPHYENLEKALNVTYNNNKVRLILKLKLRLD